MKGFCFIEVLSPCPTLYPRRNKMGDGLDTMKFYKEKSKIKNGCPTAEADLTKSGEIIVGKFVDRDRPDYISLMKNQMVHTLGDRYKDEYAAQSGGEGAESCEEISCGEEMPCQ